MNAELAGRQTPLKVALLGCGVVGSQVADMLIAQRDELAARVGAPLDLIGIAVRRLGRARDVDLDESLFTTDAVALVRQADIVIEVIGGFEPAREYLLEAMRAGAGVVTANKALLAEDGPTLYRAADEAGVDLYFEAAVAGAIPLVRPVKESLAGDNIERVLGIVNGTTNYVLDQMDTTGMGFAEAVEQAQGLGYAEADPTADVEGFDAAAKAAILASLAFHTRVNAEDVHREGITGVSAADVAAAREAGHVVKLLAICERSTEAGAPGVSVRVHPAMLPRSHPLAGVRGAFNAVFVESEASGSLMFYGAGAGGKPTASAVLGDVVTIARNRVLGGRGPGETGHADLPVLDMGQVLTRYHIRLNVADRPGVLAQVATEFAAGGVSIESVRQTVQVPSGDDVAGGRTDGQAVLVVGTHQAKDSALAATVARLSELDAVQAVASVLRVEGG